MDKKMDTVKLNIGGVVFKCYTATLQRYEESFLSHLNTKSEHYDETENEYFFDRNPVMFQFVLDAYRTGNLHLPKNICGVKVREELEFWGISEDIVCQCCWDTLYISEQNANTITHLKQLYEHKVYGSTKDGIRGRIWNFLHEPKSSSYAKAWSVFMSVLIIVSVLVFAVESVPSVRTDTYSDARTAKLQRVAEMITGNKTQSTLYGTITRKPHIALPTLDTVCFVIITGELLIMFCVCPKKLQFLKCWLRVSEIVCSLAYWFFFACEKQLENLHSVHLLRAMIICKHLTILKLIRLFRVAQHISELKIMKLTIVLSKYELGVLVLMLFMLTSLFGVLMFMIEAADNNTFDSVFSAMYWALITLTTVGYGKYVPSTTLGHVLAAVCSIYGLIILALPIGILASNFNNFYHHFQYVSVRMKSKELKKSKSIQFQHSIHNRSNKDDCDSTMAVL